MTLTMTRPDMAPTTEDEILPALSIQDIMERIPHRAPFLLVDRVTHHIKGKRIEGYKNVTMNEPFFPGHFPGRPLMPGVLQIEALAQLGGILLSYMPQAQNKLAVFAGIENVRFRKMVTPGDRLDLTLELTKFRPPIGKGAVCAKVDGEVVVEGELMFSLIDS